MMFSKGITQFTMHAKAREKAHICSKQFFDPFSFKTIQMLFPESQM